MRCAAQAIRNRAATAQQPVATTAVTVRAVTDRIRQTPWQHHCMPGEVTHRLIQQTAHRLRERFARGLTARTRAAFGAVPQVVTLTPSGSRSFRTTLPTVAPAIRQIQQIGRDRVLPVRSISI